MKRSLPVALAASSVLLAAFSIPANAQDYCAMNMASFIQLPDGSCVSTEYMSIRGAALSELSTAESLYNQAVELNSVRPDSYSFTDYGTTSSVTRTYDNELTDEEKERRQELQDATFANMSEAASLYDSVVTLTTPNELETMERVAGTMVGR